MNKILVILVALNCLSNLVMAADEDIQKDPDNQKLEKLDAQSKVDNLISAGVKCKKELLQVKVRGYVCIGKISTYSENIRIYIPENLDSEAAVKFNVFFHGLRRGDTFLEDNSGQGYGDYGARLKEANDNKSILIIPESSNGVSSYDQFAKKPELLTSVVEEIENKAEIKMSELTLSGHSGAYRVINSLLADKKMRSNIKNVGLFDAIYASVANVEIWLKENTQNKLRLAWLSGAGASTEQLSVDFLTRMSKYSDQIVNVKIKGSATAVHMNIMQTGGLADFIRGD